MKTLVITPGMYDRDYDSKLAHLLKSCEQKEIDISVFGRGEKFSFYDSKIVLMQRYIQDRFHDDPTITHVLYTDASDSFFLANLAEIESKYDSVRENKTLVVAVEKDCHPFAEYVDKWPESPTPYRFMNPGNFMGEIETVIMALEACKRYHWLRTDDQGHWHLAYLNGLSEDIMLDYYCALFQTMSNCDFDQEFKIVSGRLVNKVTYTMPCIVHFNGPKGGDYANQKLMDRVFEAIYGQTN